MTSEVVDDALLERRREALAASGWGAPFHFVQPHNACFWVYLALVVAGLGYVVPNVASTGSVFAQAYVTSVIAAAAFTGVFLLFLHHADRWERTPGRLAVAAFVLGGLGSTFAVAVVGNDAVISLYTKLFGQAWAQDWDAGLTAPFVEETAKGAAFLLLVGLAPVVIRTAYDGLVVGAYVGLGFQVFEDMFYGRNAASSHFGADQVSSVLQTFAVRALTGVASHALYTAVFSAGLVYLIGTPAQPRRPVRGLLLMLAAMVMHGVWDSAQALSGGTILSFAIMLLTTVFAVVVLLVAIRLGASRERRFMHDLMAPEVEIGTITETELAALSGYGKQRRAAVRHRAEGVSRRREKRILRAARDLADDLAVAGGDNTPEVEHSRAEIARQRELPR